MLHFKHKSNEVSASILTLHYASIHGFFWAASGTIYAFMTVFLMARGFSTSEVGYINSLRIGSAVIGSFFFAYVGDRFRKIPIKYLFSGVILTAWLVNTILQYTTPGFIGMSLIFIVLGLTECSVSALLDSLALQYINSGVPIKYSISRSVGSVTYALVCFFLGSLIDRFGADFIILLHGVFLILAVISALTFRTFYRKDLPAEAAPEKHSPENTSPKNTSDKKRKGSRNKGSILSLMKDNPQYTLLLIANAILCFGYWPASGFLANIMNSIGGNNSVLGIAMFVGAAFEMPALAFIYPRLSRHTSPQKILLLSIIVHFFRWSLLIFVTEPWMIIVLQGLSMFSYGLSLPAAVDYINRHIAEENRIKGQTFYNISGNLGGTLGNAVFGIILEKTGAKGMLTVSSAFIFLGVIVMFFMTKSKEGEIQSEAGNI